MALISPIHIVGPIIFFFFSIPLVLFAAVTTSLAITALTVRGSIVYVELAMAVIQSWVFSVPLRWQAQQQQQPLSTTKAATIQAEAAAAAKLAAQLDQPSPPRHRRRRSAGGTSVSSLSQDLGASQESMVPAKSDSWGSMLGAGAALNRDYEGVGGWRITSGDGGDDALWIGMNSRLELPAPSAERPSSRHRRSLTGSSSQRLSWSPEVRMSPVQSRARTPSITSEQHAEYFDLQLHAQAPPKGVDVPLVARVKDPARRKSVGGSSTSSQGSSVKANASGVKQTSIG